MDFQFTPEQELFRRSVREFADRHIRPRIAEMEETKEIPQDILTKIAEQGFFALDALPDDISAGTKARLDEIFAGAERSCLW